MLQLPESHRTSVILFLCQPTQTRDQDAWGDGIYSSRGRRKQNQANQKNLEHFNWKGLGQETYFSMNFRC